MSILSRLVSTAVAAGTAVAVGYGLKKLNDKIEQNLPFNEPQEPEKEVIGVADTKISLVSGGDGEWSYKMSEKGVVKESENTKQSASRHFDFVPVKDGITELEFDYAPQDGAPKKTITYSIEVKDGKVIKCDAAGDLEMLKK